MPPPETHERTHAQTDGQIENVIPQLPIEWSGGGHKDYTKKNVLLSFCLYLCLYCVIFLCRYRFSVNKDLYKNRHGSKETNPFTCVGSVSRERGRTCKFLLRQRFEKQAGLSKSKTTETYGPREWRIETERPQDGHRKRRVMRCYLNVRAKVDISQANRPHGTINNEVGKN